MTVTRDRLVIVFLLLIGIIAGVVLYFISIEHYLLFHGLIEVTSIMVAFAVFAVGWNSKKFTNTSFFLYLGVTYLFVSFIDLLHTFAYKGMGIFPGYDANLPTQLWIAARYIESVSLLLILIVRNRNFNVYAVFTSYLVVSSLIITSIFWRIFPTCYIEGVGLTPFKIGSEFIISFILIVTIILLHRVRNDFDPTLRMPLYASLFLTIAAELSFTLYIDVYGVMNLVGHYFKLLSFIFIYIALVRGSLIKPYQVLFNDLEKSRQEETERAEKLETVNKDLEAFTSAISHDIKTPLMVIENNAELLDYMTQDDNMKRILVDIQDSSKRVISLVNDLMRLSRISYQSLTLEEVDITQVVKNIVEDLKKSDPRRNVTFTVHEGMKFNCDRALMTIALQNLLHNAWKYTSKNQAAEIEIGMLSGSDVPTLFVRDNGIGFSQDDAALIFEPFKRSERAKGFQGTGIGLPIVQRIVNAHHGHIWAESTLGEGATFYITLDV